MSLSKRNRSRVSFSEHFSLTLIKLVIFSKPSDLPQSYTKGCIVKVDFIYYGGHCQSKPDQLTQITLDGSTGKKEEAFVNETLDTGLASDSSFSEEETRVDAIISRKRRRSDETMPQRRCFFN